MIGIRSQKNEDIMKNKKRTKSHVKSYYYLNITKRVRQRHMKLQGKYL